MSTLITLFVIFSIIAIIVGYTEKVKTGILTFVGLQILLCYICYGAIEEMISDNDYRSDEIHIVLSFDRIDIKIPAPIIENEEAFFCVDLAEIGEDVYDSFNMIKRFLIPGDKEVYLTLYERDGHSGKQETLIGLLLKLDPALVTRYDDYDSFNSTYALETRIKYAAVNRTTTIRLPEQGY